MYFVSVGCLFVELIRIQIQSKRGCTWVYVCVCDKNAAKVYKKSKPFFAGEQTLCKTVNKKNTNK